MFGDLRNKAAQSGSRDLTASRTHRPGCWGWIAAPALAVALAGCAAHHPLSGIPVEQLPEELRHPVTWRSGRQTIDLSLLRQTPPAEHHVDAGDVLGIYIDGILGGEGNVPAPPVYAPQDTALPPAMGHPVTVRGDGTISLPGYAGLHVSGLTLREVEERIRAVCSGGDQPLLQVSNHQIIVSLQRPRVARVLVIRQEGGNDLSSGPRTGDITTNQSKRGAGRVVALPAYQNDVLHALAETGGLPGVDAENVIYIIRGAKSHTPAVAPALPGPADRQVDRGRGSLRGGFRSVRASQSRGGSGRIQLVGGLVRDPFMTAANRFESPAAAGDHEESIEMWPSAPHPGEPVDEPLPLWQPEPATIPQVASESPPAAVAQEVQTAMPDRTAGLPVPILPPPGVLSPRGHSSIQERSGTAPDDLAVDGALPPLPPAESESSSVQTDVEQRARDLQPGDAAGSGWTTGAGADGAAQPGSRIICIPLKVLPGEPLPFDEEDIVLHDGDVVLVESREQDFFMTGGLLGGGQYPLPRDYDITVIDAIAMAEQTGTNRPLPTRALGGVSALNQDVTVGASKVILLRTLPSGCEVPIEVDLYEAIRDPNQRVIVQAGDRIILQYTRMEAIGAFFERHILDGAVIGLSSAAVFSN